ncbi:esterase-like activity of phytase family protein [Maridesulfovibrio zosterae]|uniref:esterase-like activity of phytase family protein n=1 Tax=Maridesulfovibrio zosterae TaxID=82171 RepID=UPI000424BD97|nr:esterase-like activity of phytase family protein [Maridesulfovibrio zosterae]
MIKIIIFILILCFTPITLLFGPSTMNVDAKQPTTNPITVKLTASQVGPLENDNVDLGVSNIKYLGTLLLYSPHPAFGGFSDLLISNDRKSLLAVTDMGFWMKADIKYSPSGFLRTVSEKAQLGQLCDTNGNTYSIKYNADAEGLSRAPGGGYLVSFERIHRINLFKNKNLSLAGKPTNFTAPKKIKDLPDNSGIESMLLLPNKDLLIISEGDSKSGPLSYASILKKKKWTEYMYQRSQDYRPTSAANLPANEVLILERRYKGPGTLGIRFRKFNSNEIKADQNVRPELVFELPSILPLDNYEGVDTITTEDGKTFIYIISDDNFSPLQHTLLTLFELNPDRQN